MPAGFDSCVRRGGRVRTKTLSGGRYMHICFIDGKSYAGEVKNKKKSSVKGKKHSKVRKKKKAKHKHIRRKA